MLWARDWSLVYGATAVGTAVVLAAYFAGLMLGAAVGARLAVAWLRRPGAPLGLYAALEVGVAFAALGYLALRPLLPAAAVALSTAMPAGVVPFARALFVLAVLIVPTTMLGASLPAAAVVLPPVGGAAAGRLYAWNTLGGAVGALTTGVVAIRFLGVRGTFLAAAALDLVVASAALWIGRGTMPRPAPKTAPPSVGLGRGRPEAALAIAATIGFAGLADEVLWTRGLAGVLSNSVYSIALVLGAVLLGLALGARLGARRAEHARNPAPPLAGACLALAAATAVSLAALPMLPVLSERLALAFRVTGPTFGLLAEAILAALVVLLPAICLGAVFPLTLALAGGAHPAQTMGLVLAANTAGGLAGALAGAFLVLPVLGLGGGLLGCAGLAAGAGLVAAEGTRLRVASVAGVALAAILVLALPTVRVAWREHHGEQLLFYRDGATATVMVTDDGHGEKRLRVNGQYSLGGTDGLFLERREAHLPLLLHARPERALAIGIGTGATIGAALAHPGLEVDGVEIVPETLTAAALFADENDGMLAHPRAHLFVDDARSHLLASRQRYDVIVSELFLPWTAGTAYLYSLDFYRLGREHLAPGGLYCQWLPLHQLGRDDLETIVGTFARAFPAVELWMAYHRTRTPLAALIGSERPPTLDAAALRARAQDPALAAALSAAMLDDPGDLALLYVASDAQLRAATREVPPITDDRPRLEFTAPAAYFHQERVARESLAWVEARLDPGPSPVAGALAPAVLRKLLLDAQTALLAGDGPGELRSYLDAFTLAPGARVVRQAVAAIGRDRLIAGDTGMARALAGRLAALAPGSREATWLARAAGDQ